MKSAKVANRQLLKKKSLKGNQSLLERMFQERLPHLFQSVHSNLCISYRHPFLWYFSILYTVTPRCLKSPLYVIPGFSSLPNAYYPGTSREWGNETENRQGVALSQALLSKDLTCLNDGRTTEISIKTRGYRWSNRSGTDLKC